MPGDDSYHRRMWCLSLRLTLCLNEKTVCTKQDEQENTCSRKIERSEKEKLFRVFFQRINIATQQTNENTLFFLNADVWTDCLFFVNYQNTVFLNREQTIISCRQIVSVILSQSKVEIILQLFFGQKNGKFRISLRQLAVFMQKEKSLYLLNCLFDTTDNRFSEKQASCAKYIQVTSTLLKKHSIFNY